MTIRSFQNRSPAADIGGTKPLDLQETFRAKFGRSVGLPASVLFFVCVCVAMITPQSVFHSGGTKRVQEWKRT